MVLTKVAFLVISILPFIIFRIYLLNSNGNYNDPIEKSNQTIDIYYNFFTFLH